MKYYQAEDNENNIEKNKPGRIGFKDILALAIAQFMILVPIALVAILVFFLLLLFFSKVWLRN